MNRHNWTTEVINNSFSKTRSCELSWLRTGAKTGLKMHSCFV